ncbi:MAG TPA: hypothetical protein VEG44_05585 [Candidatus Acidoferrales bacterium]|nr:hypothetical protein [Candidatus Acidoferrales bacterium]
MNVPARPKIKSPGTIEFLGFLSINMRPNMAKNIAIESLPEHLESTTVTISEPFKLVKITLTPSTDIGTPKNLNVDVEIKAVTIENEDEKKVSINNGNPTAIP